MTLCLLCLRPLEGHDATGPMPPVCAKCFEQVNAMPPARRMAILLKAQQIHDDRKKVDALGDILELGGNVTNILGKAQRSQEKIDDADNWWRGDEDDED